ncbi:hypothetical protein N7519_006484 [Penicillium mononematosum]|uniref:uncharacterized protein n=1 Tax=Penicillium mononematosum TaxID=268346 RepID=UPI002547F4BC|nr:uncharacterized protein N7519_006484 [Penicillium mononematosum]KAJ6185183.1 hypothetical protein N7519_006484 [Penicillium mononematosum]
MYSVDRLPSGSGNFRNSHEKAPFDLVANLLDLDTVDIFAQVKHQFATVISPYTVSWATGDGSAEGWGEEEENRKRREGWEAFYIPIRAFLKWTSLHFPYINTTWAPVDPPGFSF